MERRRDAADRRRTRSTPRRTRQFRVPSGSDRVAGRARSASRRRSSTRFAASAGATVGNDVDLLETSRVRRTDFNASLDLRPSSRLRINATYVSSAFTRRSDGERRRSRRIPRVKLEYQLARPLFVRVVSQYTATRREALRDPRTGQISSSEAGARKRRRRRRRPTRCAQTGCFPIDRRRGRCSFSDTAAH